MRIELRTSVNNAYSWWCLVARNGQVLATSETYDTRSNAKRAAKRMSAQLKLPIRIR